MSLINYIVGQSRFYLSKLNPRLIRLHIREQVDWRQSACSPQCKYEARCCGCKTPNVFYAPKACGYNSYPKLMNKHTWDLYKQEYERRLEILHEFKLFVVYDNLNIYYINKLTPKELFNLKVRPESITTSNDEFITPFEDIYVEGDGI